MPRLRRTAPAARRSDAPLAAGGDLSAVTAAPGHDVSVGDDRVFVRVTPSAEGAEPALFIHGLGGSSLNWTDFAALLSDRLAVEAIDLPGHGRSGPPTSGRYDPPAFADVVVAYLEQSGRGPVHLAGNSMGGAIAALVAARRPDLVRTLTLVSPAVPDNRPRIYPLRNDPRLALLVVPVLGEWVMKQFNRRYAVEVRAKGTIKVCFANPSRYPKARLAEAVAEAERRADLPWAESAILRSTRGLAGWQLLHGRAGWAQLRRITAPTLVVWGDTDRLVAPDLAPYVAAAIDDARLAVLADIGHTAMMEDPPATAGLVLGLLEDAARG